MPKEPIIPIGISVFDSELPLEALQNRNKTNLLATLGAEPPLVEELVPETNESRIMESMITRSLSRVGSWMGHMTGLNQTIGGIQGELGRLRSKVLNQYTASLEQFFLPIQGMFREIEHQYIAYVSQFETGAAIGSTLGSAFGYVIGNIYLGPIGGAVLGAAGNVAGGLIGAGIEQGFWAFVNWISETFYPGAQEWKGEDPLFPGGGRGPPGGADPIFPLPSGGNTGGVPQYQSTRGSYRQRTVIPLLINKLNTLEARLY